MLFYDDNNISIDGHVDGWFTDDTQKRFEAYGWYVIPAVDGHNAEQIIEAIKQAQAEKNKPTLIMCKTIIGYGSPNKQNTHDSHGAPLGDEEIALTRQALNWSYAPLKFLLIFMQNGMLTKKDKWRKTHGMKNLPLMRKLILN